MCPEPVEGHLSALRQAQRAGVQYVVQTVVLRRGSDLKVGLELVHELLRTLS
jgi:hypothetical protein